MKQFLLFLITASFTLFVACNTGGGGIAGNHDGYVIKGKINNMTNEAPIYLEEISAQTAKAIDTATVKADGTFEIMGKVPQKTLGRLRVGNSLGALIIIDNVNMNVEMNIQNPNEFNSTGSSETAQLHQLIKDIQTKQPAERDAFLKSYVDTVKSPLLGYMALSNLRAEENYELYQKFGQRLQSEMPNSTLTQQFQQYLAQIAGLASTSIGKEAPDIKLQSPGGKEISLSSLRGKVVLLDFWASWCRPCRQENPNVVKAYEKYKSKGFEIYSVSLDNKKELWEKAIKDDNLTWPAHVSDLGGWNSGAAALYGVRSIPSSFLLDKEGKIIAKNLRGGELDTKIGEALGS